ncbi:hypothetical protein FHU12_3248 [Serratia marcescens]|uniref:Ead/Ea22-like family protein n=1 Tax=Serratia marcescens TaxID=615 RepID=A0AA46QCG4_SERMA|nr:hypothetical protein [Serratia marcescens]TQI85678.1 hypothetical protein FHU12_3248 [Serratia marcescens]HEJ7121072.1 hypothetical protein [Serratia marcescens]
MTTIKRFTPDYKMHAVRFEAFAREAEHGELVRFDAHQQVVSAVEAERDAQQKRADALAVENAVLKDGFEWLYAVVSSDEVSIPDEKYSAVTNAAAFLSETPATDAALAAIRDKHRAEGINFAANRLLAAFEHGFIDKPAGEVADVAKMILSAVTELPGAPEEDFTRDYSDEVIAMIRAELREAK